MRYVNTDKEPVELPKYVYKSKNGFEIRKRIGEHVEYFGRFNDLEKHDELKNVEKLLCNVLRDMEKCIEKKNGKSKIKNIMVTGLGNRFATPDAFGPVVMENMEINRHIISEYSKDIESEKKKVVCGITPGVMSQTGIETSEIINGLVKDIKPDCLI